MQPLKVEIGNTPILIELDNPHPFGEIKALYAPFITAEKCRYRIKATARLKAGHSPESEKVSFSFVNGVYKIKFAEFKAVLDLNSRLGSVEVSSPWPQQALVSALTNLYVFLKLNRGGIVFHASAVVRKNLAYVFFGPSGAGKSTVVEVSREHTVLSEELIGLDFLNRSYYAFAFPYYGDLRFSLRTNACFKVAGLFKLVKDRRNYLKAIPKPRALVDFFTFPYDLRILRSFPGYFNQHHRLIESVACNELHFVPDSSFWRCIDESLN